ncbi:hypothetical protein H1P_5330001 [Hyella patelloides LEGE 07179]|uniref:Uncharacterized protein n=1 Tax=Hyella patelloides LEGE 07179 TaxID=945734 RepID=A0A563W0J9_9CYAN|nr:hypothetical protein H1P_5330001 [Hyella patelloides LEGE 07179]
MWEMLKAWQVNRLIRAAKSCFGSPNVGDVEIIGKVERSRGLKIHRLRIGFYFFDINSLNLIFLTKIFAL